MGTTSFRAAALLLAILASAACLPLPLPAQRAADAPAVDTALLGGLDFRMVGPFRGGRSTAVAGVVDRPGTYFMGSTGGGVWKTEDDGLTWTNVSDGFFGGGIGAIAIAGADPNVIYVGTGSACIRGNISMGHGLYRSTDGGKSWRFSGLPDAGQVGAIVVDPRDADRVYVAALGRPFGRNRERGVFRSIDGGRTWEHVLFVNDSAGAVDLAMNPRNPREIYAGVWRAERKPWTLISGGGEGGVYKTSDGGDTWEKLGGGLPAGIVGKVGVTVSPADPDRVWAIVEAEPEGGVYRSDDAGKTWTRVNTENKLRQRAWYYTHIRVDPRDASTVYALNTSLYRSTDGGKTFEPIEVPHGDVHDLWIHPEHPERMVVADDGGAQVTMTAGRSWSSMDNQPTAEIYDVVVDNGIPYRLYGAQQDNTTISVPAWSSSNTLHAKEHWRFVGGCETGPVALHPDRPSIVYAGCYGGAIDRSDLATGDRRNVNLYPQLQLGQARSDLRERFQWVSPIVVSPHDSDVVYHASQRIHRFADGGMTWETISPDLTTNNPEHQGLAGGPINADGTGVEVYNTVFALAVSPHSPDELWAGSDDGRVHVTRNGGAAWSDVTPRGMPSLGTVDEIEVSPHRPGKAYVAVHRYRLDDFAPYIFRTGDHGKTWTRLTDGTNGIPANRPVRTVREDPDREGLLYAGTEAGLYVSFDDGRRWQPLQLDLPVAPVTGIKVRHKDLIVSTQGRSFWVLDDITPLHQIDDAVARARVHLFEPRDALRVDTRGASGPESPEPRPAGALLYYYLAQAPGEAVTLEILDGSDRVVRTFTSDSARAKEDGTGPIPAGAGMHRVTWDLTYAGPRRLEKAVVWGYTDGVKAPPGTYRVRLTAGGETQTRTLRVLGDPRLTHVADRDYAEQFDLAVQVRDTVDRVYDAIRSIRSVREQVGAAAKRAGEAGSDPALVAAADSLAARLSAVEAELIQTKSESGQDPIRFPSRLDNQFAELYGYVTGVDAYISGGPEGRPTRAAYTRFADLNAVWATLRDRLQAILDREVPAFNERLRQAGVPAVTVPRPGARRTIARVGGGEAHPHRER